MVANRETQFFGTAAAVPCGKLGQKRATKENQELSVAVSLFKGSSRVLLGKISISVLKPGEWRLFAFEPPE